MYSVLYVDDEPNLLGITKLYLEKSKEFIVDTRESAQEGLAALKLQPFDAVVSDYQMPGMDGIHFLKEVRSGYGDIPFILFTGKGREEVVIEAINCGANFYLQKGGDPKAQFAELSHKIRQAVQRRDMEASLRTSEKVISDIINFMPDATFAIDRAGKVISWNRAMEEMTGAKAGELIGKANYDYAMPFYGTKRPMLIDMIFQPDEDQQKRYYSFIRKEGNVLIAESEDARPKGKGSILWTKATPLYDARGNIIGAIESIRDITEFRRLDRAQRQEKEELQKAGIRIEYSPGLFDKLIGKSANAWLKQGIERYYKYGNFQEALQCFDRVLEIEPKNARAWNGRGVCLKELGRYEEALQSFDRVIESNDEEIYFNKGETLEKMAKANGEFKLYVKAIAYFDRVISMNPYHAHALNYRGVCLKEMGRYEEAKKYFDLAQFLIRSGENKAKRRLTFSPPRKLPNVAAEFSRHAESQLPVSNLENTGIRNNGSRKILETIGISLRGRDGSTSGYHGKARDTTELKTAIEQLHSRQILLDAILQSAEDGILVITDQGEILTTNHRFQELWRIPEDHVASGKNEALLAYVLDQLEDREEFLTELKRLNGTNEEGSGTVQLKDGRIFERYTRMISLHGRYERLWSFRDITERIKAEEALTVANKKFKLLSSITRHDISNQLTILHGYLDLLKDSQSGSASSEYFQKVVNAVKRVSAMIQFTKEYEEIGVNVPVWQDCRTLEDTAAKEAPAGKILLQNDIPPGTEIFGDPMIVRVFYNLIDNAVRHGGKITTIRFSLENRNGDQIIVCEDDGVGIPDKEKEKIFDRDFGKNTGLGLFLSREILSITGMSITETGIPGKGARFEILVPKGMYRFTDGG